MIHILPGMLGLLVLFICFPAVAADNNHSLLHGGHERHYIVHTPAEFSIKSSLPIVLLFHGGGSTPEGLIRQSSMNELADKYNKQVLKNVRLKREYDQLKAMAKRNRKRR